MKNFLASLSFVVLFAVVTPVQAKNQVVESPIKPIPLEIQINSKKVKLGDLMFHDKRLSKNNAQSCASCHSLQTGGADLRPKSIGVDGKAGGVNSPTVYNSGFNFVQFWDGRAKDLKEQADGPVNNPIEMASTWTEVLGKLKKDSKITQLFAEAFPNRGMTGETIREAIAEFEKSLITPNAPFDQYLRGKKDALSAEAKAGYDLFDGYGCTSCHNGVNVGGNSFQKFGLVKDYFSVRGNIQHEDYGRFNVTKDEADKFKFKVPSLRTAVLTPPYFHDATAKTIEEAIQIMGRHQVGVELKPDEVQKIKAFLESLVGEYGGKSLLGRK